MTDRPLFFRWIRLIACVLGGIGWAVSQAAAQTDYSWNNAGVGVSAGLWSDPTNWIPNSGVGGPGAADNIVTPTLAGVINVNIASAQVTIGRSPRAVRM